MAPIAGSVRMGGFIAPTDSADTYPVTKPIYGLGGLRSVADHTERNAITLARCEEGMQVYTINDSKTWRLNALFHTPLEDGDWTEIVDTGATNFIALTDTPSAYTDAGGFLVMVNIGENALEFIDPATAIPDNETDPIFSAWLSATPPIYSLSGAVLTSQATPQTVGSPTERLTKLYAKEISASLTSASDEVISALDIYTISTSTIGCFAYNIYGRASSSVVSTEGTTELIGVIGDARKSGADTGTTNSIIIGVKGYANNVGATNTGVKKTYGGYFESTGGAGGTSTAYGVWSTASGADTNYSFYGDNGTLYNEDGVLIGSDANFTDFSTSKMVVSNYDTGFTYSASAVGLMVEGGNRGLYAVSTARGAVSGYGLVGRGLTEDTANTGVAYGGYLVSTATHAGGNNVALSVEASGSATGNYAILITDGDINSLIAVDWDLIDNNSSALSFDTTSLAGILEIDTTNSAEGVNMSGRLKVGTNASFTDYTRTQAVFSTGDTGDTSVSFIGLVGEAVASNGVASSMGVRGAAKTDGDKASYGVVGKGLVGTTTDSATAYGAYFESTVTHSAGSNYGTYSAAESSEVGNIAFYGRAVTSGAGYARGCYAYAAVANTADTGTATGGHFSVVATHAGGDNIGVYAQASGGAVNYSLYGANGTLYNADGVLVGSNASFTDFSGAKAVFSQSNTTATDTSLIGIVGEATATNGALTAMGVYGVGKTAGDKDGSGVYGAGRVGASADTGIAYGGQLVSIITHAGGDNIALSLEASGSDANNYALKINAGDINSVGDVIWLLKDNIYHSLTFDSPGKTGILMISTINGKEAVFAQGRLLAGSADDEDCLEAALTGSAGRTYDTNTAFIGVVGEAVAEDGVANAMGLRGVAKTDGDKGCFGVVGKGLVTATADTGIAYGGYFYATETHAGANNIGVYSDASGGADNFSFYGAGGTLYNASMAKFGAQIHIKEITTPTAIADYGALYTKSDNKLYFQDGGGTEHEVTLVS